jgi:Tol biopolymer transport system component
MITGKPVWSPTGSKIAFMAKEGEKPWGVYVVDAAGGLLKRITDDAHAGHDPSWSPDGTRLLYESRTWFNSEESDTGVFEIFDLARERSETIPGTLDFYGPSWSPDGRVIAASLHLKDKMPAELAIYDMAQRKWSRFKTPMFAGIQGFSHDSKYVYSYTYNGGLTFYRMRISDGMVESIPEKSKIDFMISTIGPFIPNSQIRVHCSVLIL